MSIRDQGDNVSRKAKDLHENGITNDLPVPKEALEPYRPKPKYSTRRVLIIGGVLSLVSASAVLITRGKISETVSAAIITGAFTIIAALINQAKK